MSNYYENQLTQIEQKGDFAPKIKVFANGNGIDTNFMDLNEESAKALINWLQKNYINKQ